jgi:hypothetical protein
MNKLDECDFEGTQVLEKLAEIGKVEEFLDAVDSDNFSRAKALMKRANIDLESIAIVLSQMSGEKSNT